MCNVELNNLLMSMEINNYKKIYELFCRYNAYPTFDINSEVHNLEFVGTASQCQVSSPVTMTMNSVFHSINGFNEFIEDMARLVDMFDEEILRQHNPALRRAYEEYQLLLKLTR